MWLCAWLVGKTFMVMTHGSWDLDIQLRGAPPAFFSRVRCAKKADRSAFLHDAFPTM
jgi:hypothetical protein